MKKVMSLIILGVSFSSFANLNLDQIKGNSCIVKNYESDTEAVDLVSRNVLTSNFAQAHTGINQTGDVDVIMYSDELLKINNSRYTVYAAGFPISNRLTLNLQKEVMTENGYEVESTSTVENKSYISYYDRKNSISIECN